MGLQEENTSATSSGIYYNNELQDFRADPASLAKDFPLQLYLKEGGG